MNVASGAVEGLLISARDMSLAAGELLVREGDEATDVFFVRSGRLEAFTNGRCGDVLVGGVGIGDLIGEIAVVTGQRRMASLRAVEPSVVSAVDRPAFEAWVRDRPDLAEDIAAKARERIDRSRVAVMIEDLVGSSDRTCVQDMLDAVEWRQMEAGTVLFREGDTADAAYFIVSGRLAVTKRGRDGSGRLFDEMGKGEIVGELGLIDGAPRSATVRAIRDTTLARFSAEAFHTLIARHAGLALHVVRGVMRRNDRPLRRARAASVAVAVTAPIDVAGLVATLLAELNRHGRSAHLSSERVDAELHESGISQLDARSVGVPRLSEFLHQADVEHDHLLYQVDPGPDVTPWTRRSLRHADRVVLVMSASPDKAEIRHLQALTQQLRETENVSCWLAVLHPSGTRPKNSAELLHQYAAEEIVHLHVGDAADVARLARMLIGQGVGLVLSGGGARGFAHIGAFRALHELGVPVDCVGGASIGAPIGAAIALALAPDELLETVTRQFHKLLDYTVPVVSVLRGARITNSIEATLGSWDVEDLWLSYYCVSTNLTASRLEVHRRGDLARAVRASVAIPGVLPPVPFHGDLLVDGGVLSNLPVEPMRSHPGIGRVIAVNVAPETGPRAHSDYGSAVSGWRALRSSIGRRRSPYPSLAGVLMGTMVVSSLRDHPTLDTADGRDLAVDIDVKGVSMLAFDRVKPVAESGYEAARPIIESWLAHRPLPTGPVT